MSMEHQQHIQLNNSKTQNFLLLNENSLKARQHIYTSNTLDGTLVISHRLCSKYSKKNLNYFNNLSKQFIEMGTQVHIKNHNNIQLQANKIISCKV